MLHRCANLMMTLLKIIFWHNLMLPLDNIKMCQKTILSRVIISAILFKVI